MSETDAVAIRRVRRFLQIMSLLAGGLVGSSLLAVILAHSLLGLLVWACMIVGSSLFWLSLIAAHDLLPPSATERQ